MKKIIILLTFFSTTSAQAGSTFCSGPTMYYSDVTEDHGIEPPEDALIGKTVIVYDGNVLINRKKFSGFKKLQSLTHSVKFEGEEIVLETTGNQTSGDTTYTQVMVLYKLDKLNTDESEEIARESVVCKTSWAMVP